MYYLGSSQKWLWQIKPIKTTFDDVEYSLTYSF